MRLILFHPGLASFDCQQCKEYIYDFDTGERKTYLAGPKREEQPMMRPPNVKTPCNKCAKMSPKEAETFQLNERNQRTCTLYRLAKATNFEYLTKAEKRDPIIAHNFAVLDFLHREHERRRHANELAHQLLPAITHG